MEVKEGMAQRGECGLKSLSARMATNVPIQGTAADLMKIAMIELDQKLEAGWISRFE